MRVLPNVCVCVDFIFGSLPSIRLIRIIRLNVCRNKTYTHTHTHKSRTEANKRARAVVVKIHEFRHSETVWRNMRPAINYKCAFVGFVWRIMSNKFVVENVGQMHTRSVAIVTLWADRQTSHARPANRYEQSVKSYSALQMCHSTILISAFDNFVIILIGIMLPRTCTSLSSICNWMPQRTVNSCHHQHRHKPVMTELIVCVIKRYCAPTIQSNKSRNNCHQERNRIISVHRYAFFIKWHFHICAGRHSNIRFGYWPIGKWCRNCASSE